jgi:hypothetical protein
MTDLPPELWSHILRIKRFTAWKKRKEIIHKGLQVIILTESNLIFQETPVYFSSSMHVGFLLSYKNNLEVNKNITLSIPTPKGVRFCGLPLEKFSRTFT